MKKKNHHKKNRKTLIRRIVPLLLVLFMIVTMLFSAIVAMAEGSVSTATEEDDAASGEDDTSSDGVDALSDDVYWPTGIEVTSPSAIVMEADTGTILYEKNSHDEHYPASITKILTGLVAVENSEMDEIVTFSPTAVYENEGDSSHIARDVNEEMTMEQCLYGMLLESANECAYAIAEHVGGGDVDTFLRMMNEKAKELGCQNTHFTNPNGLPAEDHYTSAYDMALIGRAALANDQLAVIMATKSYTIPPTNRHEEETFLNNHHKMLHYYKTSQYLYEGCLGGKTGYTTDANNTLVTFAERDGMTLICVVMNVDSPYHYTDTISLLDYCFDNFRVANAEEEEGILSDLSSASVGSLVENINVMDLEITGRVVLPKMVSLSDTDLSIEPLTDEDDPSVIGELTYDYGQRQVGFGKLVFLENERDEYVFDKVERASEIEADPQNIYVRLNFKLIFAVLFGVIALVLLIILIRKKLPDFYRFRQRARDKRNSKKPQHKIIYRRRRKRGRRRR